MATNYNGNTDLIRGDKLFIYIGTSTKPIAYSTSCSLEMSFETIDTANKMSGNWVSSLLGQGSWSISTDALIAKTQDQSIDAVFDAMVGREAIKITMAEAGADYVKGTSWFEGEGFISSCNVNANNGEVASMSITITGSGELKRIKVA